MDYVRKTFTYDGKRYQVYGHDEKEAIAKMALKKDALKRGEKIRSSSATVKQWGEFCVKTYKTNQSDITRDRYLSVMRSSVFSQIGGMKVKCVTPIDCQKCLNLQEGRSKHHIDKVHRMLVFIFEKAVENKMILESPAAHLVKPKGTTSKSRALTDEERGAVLSVCQNDKYLIFLFMLYCGCRPSEARSLQGMDIMDMNGRKMLHIRGTKTKNADRIVPLPPFLYEKVKTKKKSEYLVGKKLTNLMYSQLVAKWKDEIREELGGEYEYELDRVNKTSGKRHYKKVFTYDPLASDFRPYYLRHTYCTDLRDNGIDIRDAQYLMGHSDISITANIYTHSDSSVAVRVSEMMSY